jgi:hypothetical protein
VHIHVCLYMEVTLPLWQILNRLSSPQINWHLERKIATKYLGYNISDTRPVFIFNERNIVQTCLYLFNYFFYNFMVLNKKIAVSFVVCTRHHLSYSINRYINLYVNKYKHVWTMFLSLNINTGRVSESPHYYSRLLIFNYSTFGLNRKYYNTIEIKMSMDTCKICDRNSTRFNW